MSVFALNIKSIATALLMIVIVFHNLNKANSMRVPRIDLGEVDLNQYPNCDQQLKPYRYKCEANYVKSVNETIHRHNKDLGTDSVRRSTCCGIWTARDCVVNAAIGIKECGEVVAKLYRELPTNSEIIEEVADMCSEYDQSAPICKNNAILLASFCNLLSFFILRIIIDL